MTSPDRQVQPLRDAVERQRIQRERAQEVSREIARERQQPQPSEQEGERA